MEREDPDNYEPIPGSSNNNMIGTGFHDMDHMKARNATKQLRRTVISSMTILHNLKVQ